MERLTNKDGSFKERSNGNIPYSDIRNFVSKVEDIMEECHIENLDELKKYAKMKDRFSSEFSCENDKIIQHYVLGGEHEMSLQDIVECLNALVTIDCDLQTSHAYIQNQEKKNKVLEKALELLIDDELYETGIDKNSLCYKDSFSNDYNYVIEQAKKELGEK